MGGESERAIARLVGRNTPPPLICEASSNQCADVGPFKWKYQGSRSNRGGSHRCLVVSPKGQENIVEFEIFFGWLSGKKQNLCNLVFHVDHEGFLCILQSLLAEIVSVSKCKHNCVCKAVPDATGANNRVTHHDAWVQNSADQTWWKLRCMSVKKTRPSFFIAIRLRLEAVDGPVTLLQLIMDPSGCPFGRMVSVLHLNLESGVQNPPGSSAPNYYNMDFFQIKNTYMRKLLPLGKDFLCRLLRKMLRNMKHVFNSKGLRCARHPIKPARVHACAACRLGDTCASKRRKPAPRLQAYWWTSTSNMLLHWFFIIAIPRTVAPVARHQDVRT